MVKAIESKSEFETVINSQNYVFIDFWATWCGRKYLFFNS